MCSVLVCKLATHRVSLSSFSVRLPKTAIPQSVIFDVFVFDVNIGQCLESGVPCRTRFIDLLLAEGHRVRWSSLWVRCLLWAFTPGGHLRIHCLQGHFPSPETPLTSTTPPPPVLPEPPSPPQSWLTPQFCLFPNVMKLESERQPCQTGSFPRPCGRVL